jgi:thiol-disulfide isomerase/thioredoxin
MIKKMKKILIIIFALFTFKVFAVDKSTTFNNEIFQKAQLEGKTVVINSWNETCTTCKVQIKILDQAEKEFKNVLFLSFEQTKDKDIAKQLGIDYWTTIVVYKNNKEVHRSIGLTDKTKIYELIKS